MKRYELYFLIKLFSTFFIFHPSNVNAIEIVKHIIVSSVLIPSKLLYSYVTNAAHVYFNVVFMIIDRHLSMKKIQRFE